MKKRLGSQDFTMALVQGTNKVANILRSFERHASPAEPIDTTCAIPIRSAAIVAQHLFSSLLGSKGYYCDRTSWCLKNEKMTPVFSTAVLKNPQSVINNPTDFGMLLCQEETIPDPTQVILRIRLGARNELLACSTDTFKRKMRADVSKNVAPFLVKDKDVNKTHIETILLKSCPQGSPSTYDTEVIDQNGDSRALLVFITEAEQEIARNNFKEAQEILSWAEMLVSHNPSFRCPRPLQARLYSLQAICFRFFGQFRKGMECCERGINLMKDLNDVALLALFIALQRELDETHQREGEDAEPDPGIELYTDTEDDLS